MKTLSILTKCIIDRSKWLRGEGAGPSRLLRATDGKMCCLGQFCLQAGATEEEIKERCAPWDLEESATAHAPQLLGNPELLGNPTEVIVGHAMAVNDDYEIDDPKREAKLKDTFLQLTPPVELTFIN